MRFRDVIRDLIRDQADSMAAAAGQIIRDNAASDALAARAEYEARLEDFPRLDSAEAAQRVIRDFYGNGATRWLTQETGIKSRTARRWMSDAIPPSRIDVLIGLAHDLVQQITREFETNAEQAALAAAEAIAAAEADARTAAAAAGPALVAPIVAGYRGASAGTVEVLYDEDGDGVRRDIDEDIDFAPIAAALANDDLTYEKRLDYAEELFDSALLDAYGDLGEVLTVADYRDGFELRT